MDNKKNTADMNTNNKQSDRTAFADELNMDATTNNKQKQKNNK